MIRILLNNRVRLPVYELPMEAADEIRATFTHDNPKASDRRAAEPPTIRTYEHEGETLSLPRGGMQRVRDVLRKHRIDWEVDDRRTWENREPGFPDHRVELWDHQRPMVEEAIRRQNCLLAAPTGSGKTCVGFAIAAALKRRTLVMVWTGNLLDQWVKRARKELGLSEDEVGIVGDGQMKVRPLTIGMQQTVAAHFKRGNHDFAGCFDVVICDEVQRFAAPTLFASVDPFGAKYRIGISADETRKDRKEFLTYDLFGRVVARADEGKLIEAGRVVEVEVRVVPTAFRAPWYRYRQDWNRLLDQLTADQTRNEQALEIARSEVQAGEQVLLFTHRVEHARDLDARLVAQGISSGTLLGGADNKQAFQITREGLESGRLRAGVGTYQAIAQGLDLPSVSRGICVTPVANNRQQLGQVRGRICRASAGKDRGVLYVLWDRAVYGKRTIENLAKWQRSVSVWDGRDWVPARDFVRTLTRSSAA